ncbi:MAG: PAS domain S-box protein [Nitrospira sp.]|nr:PAS domain S-box protein [Nitrospira sp.]
MKDEEKTKEELIREIQRLRSLLSEKDIPDYQKNLETIINYSCDMLILKDKDLRYVVSNEAHRKFFNKKSEDIIGKTDIDIMPPEAYEQCRRSDEEALRSDAPVEYEEYILGRWAHVIKRRIVDDKGDIEGLVAIIRDITDYKQAMEALRKSTHLVETTFASLSDAIFIIDAASVKIIDCNLTASKMFGYSREEMLGQTTTFLHVDEAALGEFRKSLYSAMEKEGYMSQLEFCMKRKDGTVFPTEHCVMPLEDTEKNRIGWVSIIRDITKRKEMEEELLKVRKLESVSLFAGGIAHDFNNYLAGILGNIQLAKRLLSPGDNLLGMLTGAEKASLRAKDLVSQLLTFAKGGGTVRKTLIIGEAIKDWCAFALSGSKIRYECIIPDDLWLVEADEVQIHQVISNLIINAGQAMPDSGYIKVQAENITLAAADVIPLREGAYVKISIEDNGIGIPEENIRKIFDPYFSTKEKGNGLGLATAYSIIKKHDGHISVNSEVGVGTTFCVYLPASFKEANNK